MATGDHLLESVTADTVASEAKRAAKHSLPIGTPCANCNTTLAGAWCYACGQRGEEYHRSIWKLTVEAVMGLIDLDGRIWQTFPRLILRPGRLTRDYLVGHRASQVPPFRIFLVVLLMVFFAGSLDVSRNRQSFKLATPDSPEAAKVLTPEMRKNLDVQMGDPRASAWLKERLTFSLDHQDAFFAAVTDWAQRFAVVMLPIAALMLGVLFLFKKNIYVFDHLIFSMHSLSFQGLLLTIVFLLGLVVNWGAAVAVAFAGAPLRPHARDLSGQHRRDPDPHVPALSGLLDRLWAADWWSGAGRPRHSALRARPCSNPSWSPIAARSPAGCSPPPAAWALRPSPSIPRPTRTPPMWPTRTRPC